MASVSFPPEGIPPPGQLVLLTDELASPAEFILHRLLASYLKDRDRPRVILATPSNNLTKWKAIASRSNADLDNHASSGSFIHMSLMESHEYAYEDDDSWTSSLKSIYNRINGMLNPTENDPPPQRTLVIVDEISLLEWMGCSDIILSRFIRAVAAVCRKADAALIIRHHITVPGAPDTIFRLLIQLCTYHIEVLPLASGKSGAISGEIALHAGHSLQAPTVKLRPRHQALQYRLTDASAIFFERGTGAGVL